MKNKTNKFMVLDESCQGGNCCCHDEGHNEGGDIVEKCDESVPEQHDVSVEWPTLSASKASQRSKLSSRADRIMAASNADDDFDDHLRRLWSHYLQTLSDDQRAPVWGSRAFKAWADHVDINVKSEPVFNIKRD